jgi:EthD domain
MKYLMMFAARDGAADKLDGAVVDEAQRYADLPGASITAFREVADDPFATFMPGMRVYDATIEVIADDDAAVLDRITGLSERLDALVHADLSAVFAGADNVVVPGPQTPVRYQYVMRRKIGTTHEQYIDHYAKRHAEFGRITPGIEGYVQFHIDGAASEKAARVASFGVYRADSISELHLASVKAFTDAIATFEQGADAIVDEGRFVDRRNSVMFTSDVLWRS